MRASWERNASVGTMTSSRCGRAAPRRRVVGGGVQPRPEGRSRGRELADVQLKVVGEVAVDHGRAHGASFRLRPTSANQAIQNASIVPPIEANHRDSARDEKRGPSTTTMVPPSTVKALKEEIGIPVHFHTHDTSGIAAASILRASDAGVDVVDLALAAICLCHSSIDHLDHHRADVQTSAVAFDVRNDRLVGYVERCIGVDSNFVTICRNRNMLISHCILH